MMVVVAPFYTNSVLQLTAAGEEPDDDVGGYLQLPWGRV